MPHKFISLIASLLISFFTLGQEESLFRIVEEGKVGYINSEGAVVIEPKFIVGGEFSEGLAAVREKGKLKLVSRKFTHYISLPTKTL